MSRKPYETDPLSASLHHPATRRVFLFSAAAAALAGCGSQRTAGLLPGPAWPSESGLNRPIEPYEQVARDAPDDPSGVIARSNWTKTPPTTSRMNRMLPVRFITVHHDALAFTAGDARTTAARIESIRRYHRDDRGWGDIGYHFIVDRAGRVWQGRPINWQGAHVADHNEGNIGVVALGNFDQQNPTDSQVEGVRRQVASLMNEYRVPVARVKTHQEWAVTACPGRNLQRRFSNIRSNGLRA